VIKYPSLYNLLSLDVVAGSVSCCYFFGKLTNTPVHPISFLVLAITVWIIYTIDHLIDARNVYVKASSDRHQFHQVYYKVLTKVVGAISILNVGLLIFLERRLLFLGIGLAFFVVVYFIVKQFYPLLKEILIALLYTLGILLPVISNTSFQWDYAYLPIVILFFLLCWINLLVFSYIDVEGDERDGYRSAVLVLGKIRSKQMIYVLFMSSSALVLISKPIAAGLMLFLCLLIMMLLFKFSSWSNVHDRYRIIGDAVFLLPGIFSWIWM
jgi:4-hydroxybenzoate polyprenyltransferase